MIESIHNFDFLEDGHAYRADGCRGVSVTELQTRYGLVSYSKVKPEVLQVKRDLGKLLHHWTALYDITGEDNMLMLPEYAEGYARAHMLFRRQSGMEIIDIEKPMMSRIYNVLVGGTPDRRMRWKRTRDVTPDLKFCAVKQPAWAVQTGAYEMLKTGQTTLGRSERCSVQLFPDGRYDVLWYEDRSDADVFLAMIALEAWKKNHKQEDRNVYLDD